MKQMDNCDMTPLNRVCENYPGNEFHVVKCLVENGADVNRADDQGRTPLFRLVRRLVARSYSIDMIGQNYRDTIKCLVNNGADINKTTKTGETAVDLAKKHGNSEVSKYLESLLIKEETTVM